MMNHFIFYTFILSYFLLPAPPTLQTILIAVAHLKGFWKPNFNMKVWAKTNLDSMLKSRDIVLLTKVCLVKAMVFPVVMYGCESWIIKKIEHQRIDAFEPWCWGRLLRVPWTARRSNQSILKEISPWVFIGKTDVEAETPVLWPPHAKSWLIGKNSDAGRDWGQEEKGMTEDEVVGWRHRHDGHEFE